MRLGKTFMGYMDIPYILHLLSYPCFPIGNRCNKNISHNPYQALKKNTSFQILANILLRGATVNVAHYFNVLLWVLSICIVELNVSIKTHCFIEKKNVVMIFLFTCIC